MAIGGGLECLVCGERGECGHSLEEQKEYMRRANNDPNVLKSRLRTVDDEINRLVDVIQNLELPEDHYLRQYLPNKLQDLREERIQIVNKIQKSLN